MNREEAAKIVSNILTASLAPLFNNESEDDVEDLVSVTTCDIVTALFPDSPTPQEVAADMAGVGVAVTEEDKARELAKLGVGVRSTMHGLPTFPPKDVDAREFIT